MKALSGMNIAEMQGFLQEELEYWDTIRNGQTPTHYPHLFKYNITFTEKKQFLNNMSSTATENRRELKQTNYVSIHHEN